ncbi:MAG: SPOR domain-containing protein [Candidatus Omnitrophota bacterium]
MNYKNREVQPELFSSIKKTQKTSVFKKNLFRNAYKMTYSVSLDTIFVIIIAVLMLNLTSFVLGIENGKALKNTALQKSSPENIKTTLKAKKTAEVIETKVVNIIKSEEKEILKLQESTEDKEDKTVVNCGYVIQLVTYSCGSTAEREVESLAAQGLSGYVHQSGKYFVVFSDIYDSKGLALKNLDLFKKRYKDCFVKVLKNS